MLKIFIPFFLRVNKYYESTNRMLCYLSLSDFCSQSVALSLNGKWSVFIQHFYSLAYQSKCFTVKPIETHRKVSFSSFGWSMALVLHRHNTRQLWFPENESYWLWWLSEFFLANQFWFGEKCHVWFLSDLVHVPLRMSFNNIRGPLIFNLRIHQIKTVQNFVQMPSKLLHMSISPGLFIAN